MEENKAASRLYGSLHTFNSRLFTIYGALENRKLVVFFKCLPVTRNLLKHLTCWCSMSSSQLGQYFSTAPSTSSPGLYSFTLLLFFFYLVCLISFTYTTRVHNNNTCSSALLTLLRHAQARQEKASLWEKTRSGVRADGTTAECRAPTIPLSRSYLLCTSFLGCESN